MRAHLDSNRSILLRVLAAAAIAATAVIGSPAISEAAPTTCGGVVFHDHDADGERTENYGFVSTAYNSVDDPGIEGIDVAVTTASGVSAAATTDAAGVWSVSIDDADFPIRVSIGATDSDGTDYEASSIGPDNGGQVQFIASAGDCSGPFDGSGTAGNAALLLPGSTCENRPDLATSCYLFGDIAGHDSMAAVVTLPDGADDNGATDGSPFQVEPYVVRATLGQVGTVWGLDHDRESDVIYVASLVKRHTRLGSTGNPTTIYRIDGTNVAPWTTLNPGAPDPHTADSDGGWLNDFGTFDAVGRTGLGDLELSPDGRVLTTVDLAAKEIVSIAVNPDGSAGAVTRTGVSNATLPLAAGACSDADIQPFGLGMNGNALLVGVVCTAASTVGAADLPLDVETGLNASGTRAGDASQLAAWVFELDGSFSLLTEVPLPNVTRGAQNGVSNTGDANYSRGESTWRPWVDRPPFQGDFNTWPAAGIAYAQPILADIEIDGDDLIVGFMDRWGHQMGSNANYEDWTNTNGGAPYFMQQPISSGDLVRGIGDGAGNFTFPTDGQDYFYTGDNYGSSHAETALGGLAQIPGRPYSVTASFDPINGGGTWQSGGLEWFDNSDGTHQTGYRLYDGRNTLATGTFEKAAGIGDVEALCTEPAIQIGDRAWFDVDGDGLQDPDEPGMGGIELELLDTDGITILDTVTTDASGIYVFDDVPSGVDLTIRVAASNYAPGGVFAPGGAFENQTGITTTDVSGNGSDDIDSDVDPGDVPNDILPTIDVNTTVTDHTFDLGFIEVGPYRLGDTVFEDLDRNGQQDGADPGIQDVTVQLWTADPVTGAPVDNIASTTTDIDGRYVFNDLFAGDYIVAIPDTDQGESAPLAGMISTDGNGIDAPDPDDSAIDGDDNGDPAPGFASITDPVTLGGDPEPTGETTEGGTWSDTESNLTVDLGFVSVYSVGNLIWLDTNVNGVVDPGEPGLPGVTVELFDVVGGVPNVVVDTQITDADGRYRFTGLSAGDYVVALPAPQSQAGGALDGLVPTDGAGPAVDASNAQDNDHNADPGSIGATPYTAVTSVFDVGVSVPTGETDANTGTSAVDPGSPQSPAVDGSDDATIDIGFVGRYRIGDQVWRDANGNGLLDPGEPLIASVPVQLWSATPDGSPDTLIAETSTDGSGRYLFENIGAGNFVVGIPDTATGDGQPLAGLTSTSPSSGAAGDSHPTVNVDDDDDGVAAPGFASLSQPIAISDGQPVGERTEDGTWTDPDSNLTVDFGFVPGMELGNLVWVDSNNNGVVDGSESGLDGVVVSLIQVSSGAVIAATTTDANGNYRFTGLRPDDYIVEIGAANFAAGSAAQGLWPSDDGAISNDPNDDVDGNSDGATVATYPWEAGIRSGVVSLIDGTEPTGEAGVAGVADQSSNLTVDFGLYSVSIGNLVWADTDNNTILDPDEVPIADVVLSLLDGSGQPVLAPDGQPLTQTTDANGNYLFTGLRAGSYTVVVDPTNFDDGGPLDGLASSNGGVIGAPAADPSNGVDSDDNGAPNANGIVVSPAAAVPQDVPTVDFGFVQTASLGSFVWLDNDKDGIRDPGESGVSGATIEIKDATTGEVIRTLTSDSTGSWLAEDLEPGDYIVSISDTGGRSLTSLNAGSDDGIDSDFDAAGNTSAIRLAPGENNRTVYAGLIAPVLALTGSNLTNLLLLFAILLGGSGFNLILTERVRKAAVVFNTPPR